MTTRPPGESAGGELVLAIDTATRTAVVALGTRDGRLVAEERWTSQHRHGSELLERLDGLLSTTGVTLEAIGGVVAGVGPGSFTGLRVGLATAKVIAYSRRIPVAAVSTIEAIAHGPLGDGTATRVAVLLPAGTSDRYLGLVEVGAGGLAKLVRPPRLVAGTATASLDKAIGEGATLLAVDLDAANISAAAITAGESAVARLATGVLAIGTAKLRAGDTTEVAELVPAYVALPRGVVEAASGMAWSPDLR